jgi:hypothetical protein
MATRAILSFCLVLTSCAMPARLQRMGVDHNTAAAGIANELALLNILRAREDFPLHYTQINRLSGTFTVRGGAGINDAIRGATTTQTNATATTASATPSVVGTVTEQIVEGVDAITPNVSADISVTPSLDVIVLDNQKFYQGITAAIPFSTVENILSQTSEQRLLLMMLLIERIDFKDVDDNSPTKGQILFSWRNHMAADAAAFLANISCYELTAQTEQRTAVRLVPVSRLARDANGELTGLRIEDLARLDGTNLELSGPSGTSPAGDDQVFVQRPRADRGGANLRRTCAEPDLSTPPAEPVYSYQSENQALVYDASVRNGRTVKIQPEITFRSTEGVIRYVGRYLRAYEESPGSAPPVDGSPVFSVARGEPAGSLVTATILGQRYSIANDQNRRRNMQVLALVEQLVNLHKESSERPVTVPVRVLGGG